MVTKQTSSPPRLLNRWPPVRRLRSTCRRVAVLTSQRGGAASVPVEVAVDLVVILGPPEHKHASGRAAARSDARAGSAKIVVAAFQPLLSIPIASTRSGSHLSSPPSPLFEGLGAARAFVPAISRGQLGRPRRSQTSAPLSVLVTCTDHIMFPRSGPTWVPQFQLRVPDRSRAEPVPQSI